MLIRSIHVYAFCMRMLYYRCYIFDKPLTIASQSRQLVGMHHLDDIFTTVVPALHHIFCRLQPVEDVRADRHYAVLLNEFSGVFQVFVGIRVNEWC